MTDAISRNTTTGVKSAVQPTFQDAAHGSDHLSGQTDEIDGDRIDIDYTPSNYTPDTTPGEVTLAAELTSHLAALDTKVGRAFPGMTVFVDSGAGKTLVANELVKLEMVGGAVNYDLPALAGVAIGDIYAVFDSQANATTYAITITPNGAELINGVNAAITIADDYGVRGLVKVSATAWAVVWTTAGSGGVSTTSQQESVTTEVITGTDTALADTLNNTPTSAASVTLFLNGVFQRQGATFDYTISGSTITWLASSGTALDMDTDDVLIAVYES